MATMFSNPFGNTQEVKVETLLTTPEKKQEAKQCGKFSGVYKDADHPFPISHVSFPCYHFLDKRKENQISVFITTKDNKKFIWLFQQSSPLKHITRVQKYLKIIS